ncbi:MAG: CRISPR-associated protein, partial [Bacteroidetes bacterium]
MITFKEIQKKELSNLSFLIEDEKYYAHTSNKKQPETLKEHLQLVEKYFLNIIETNKLEAIIDTIINQVIVSFKMNEQLNSYIKTLFYDAIIYHDFGKINHSFQQKEGIDNFNKNIIKRKHKESSNHSSISAYLFLIHHFKQSEKLLLDEKGEAVIDFLITCFSFPIYKHHSSYLSQIDSNFAYSQENIEYLKDFLTEFKFDISNEEIEDLQSLVSDMETAFLRVRELGFSIDFFPFFTLLKLNYSLLTASDYYATSEYMSDLKFSTEEDFGLLTEEIKQRIYKHFVNNKETSYNGELIKNPKQYLSVDIDNLKEKSPENLNFLRQKLGAEVLTNIEKYKDERIFYIEAPTGGGKTNMSMIAIYKMLKLHPEINKIFYVFPFTTLITQTAKAIKETLGLTEQEVTQVHSKAGFQTKDTGSNEQDAKYGNERRNQIDNLFINYPLTLLTHIKFFDILKSNKKDTNYILHRLANSIVIIDELQAYSPEHWDKIKFYISKYAELFNIHFIIMSATLPKIDKIKMVFKVDFEHLIPKAKKYLTNPNFAKRVKVKSDLLEDKELDLSKLAEILLEKSKKYAQNRTDEYPNSVYTIIEFIFKKSASKFYDIIFKINENDDFFDEIFVLSGTIIEPRRKYIIEFLKDEQNRKKKILLITTQVVEAGVDIDMDLGFKNQSLIDSDEQLA